MNEQEFEREIKDATVKLIDLAKKSCYNNISSDLKYILANVREYNTDQGLFDELKWKRINHKKTPLNFQEVILDLKDKFSDLYDVKLLIYKALKECTIVELRYCLKSIMSKSGETNKNREPVITCSVSIPQYAADSNKKFDINWKHGGFQHNWKMFFWRRRIKFHIRRTS